ncbi:MAG: serine--tRNA ligase [bacterium]|nr:serine--tRNA ligase [bacterium]
MLDIKLIKEKTDEVRKALLKRMESVDLETAIELYDKKVALLQQADDLKNKRNTVSGEIAVLKKEKKPADDLIKEMQETSAKIKDIDKEKSELDSQLQDILEGLPNMPDEDVAAGGKENNEIIREWGSKPEFDFKPLDHVDLVTKLGLVDYERGVKLGGNGFWLYKGIGAQLEWGLINYFIEEHIKDGYEFILPPHILTYQCGYTAGQFPKFADDVFQLNTDKNDTQFLLPTSETALINYYRDEIIAEEELPKKYFSYTPCYRKEAGSYRAEERGMIRGHQFNKVEMFQFTHPNDSTAAFEELVNKAERLVQGLGLHYRVAKLAAGDCSAGMARTYDIEVWIPSMDEYKEVSSASNARDYQARRGMIRYKNKETKKNEFIHSLNASGLATSRLLPAIVEQFQQKDGSVLVPEPLVKWVGKNVLSV